MKRQLLILLICFATVATAVAATFSASYPRAVAAGDKFRVAFKLENGEGSNFEAPEVEGATLIFGPATSSSYSMSIINGKQSSSSSMTYTMTYKASAQPGTISVGAAAVTCGGKRMTTRPFTISVTAGNPHGGTGGSSNQRSQQPPRVSIDDFDSQEADRGVSANDLFVRIEMSRPRVFEQQPVVCTIKLYTKYGISEFMVNKQPAFDGFLIEEIDGQPNLDNVETYNGQKYHVAVLKRCILYPQQSGQLKIASGEYDVTAVQFVSYRTMFGTMREPVEKRLHVTSNSATVNILPLPEPKPASFTGAVGKFSITSSLKPETLKTYSAATLSYVITGTGNIKYIKAPQVTLPEQFDAYEPITDVDAHVSGANVTGTCTAGYTFIPQFAGRFTIPESEFSYFDPDAERYVTIPIAERVLNVEQGKGQPSATGERGTHIDIAGLQPVSASQLSPAREPWWGSAGYWLWYVIPLALATAFAIYFRKQLRLRSDATLMRRLRAGKVASRRLKRATALAGQPDKLTEFYAELLQALWGFMSDKLSLPMSQLNRDNLEHELLSHGVDAQLATEALALIDECQLAQYSPAGAAAGQSAMLDRAAQVIEQINKVKIA